MKTIDLPHGLHLVPWGEAIAVVTFSPRIPSTHWRSGLDQWRLQAYVEDRAGTASVQPVETPADGTVQFRVVFKFPTTSTAFIASLKGAYFKQSGMSVVLDISADPLDAPQSMSHDPDRDTVFVQRIPSRFFSKDGVVSSEIIKSVFEIHGSVKMIHAHEGDLFFDAHVRFDHCRSALECAKIWSSHLLTCEGAKPFELKVKIDMSDYLCSANIRKRRIAKEEEERRRIESKMREERRRREEQQERHRLLRAYEEEKKRKEIEREEKRKRREEEQRLENARRLKEEEEEKKRKEIEREEKRQRKMKEEEEERKRREEEQRLETIRRLKEEEDRKRELVARAAEKRRREEEEKECERKRARDEAIERLKKLEEEKERLLRPRLKSQLGGGALYEQRREEQLRAKLMSKFNT